MQARRKRTSIRFWLLGKRSTQETDSCSVPSSEKSESLRSSPALSVSLSESSASVAAAASDPSPLPAGGGVCDGMVMGW